MSTYVCSDIHGQYDLYKTMLNEINFTSEDHFYILGDMIDRGEDGIRVLQDVASRPNVTCLLGNPHACRQILCQKIPRPTIPPS